MLSSSFSSLASKQLKVFLSQLADDIFYPSDYHTVAFWTLSTRSKCPKPDKYFSWGLSAKHSQRFTLQTFSSFFYFHRPTQLACALEQSPVIQTRSMGLVLRPFSTLCQCRPSLLDLPLFTAAHLFLPNFSRSFGALFPPTQVCNFPASPQLPDGDVLCEHGSSRSFSSDCCHAKPQLFIKLEQSHLICQRVMQQ